MSVKRNDRQIPSKNYVIVLILFIISIILVLVLANWYKSYKDYQLTIPVINGVINEINDKEVDNFLLENRDTMIYIGISNDDNCRKLEEDLKIIIEKNDLQNDIVYLNLSNIDKIDDFIEKFNDKYADDKRIEKYPSFIIFKNSKIVDAVSKTKKQDLYIDDVEQLLEEHEVIAD